MSGRVLASGRASEILDLGGGRVLRRFKGAGFPEREAAVMEHARAHGFPVPAVLDVLTDALVLERVEGPTMATAMRRRPWDVPALVRTLAELHARLHAIPYGDARLLHLDLHPDNVLLAQGGPVVIDWTNARAGDPAVDVALTWLIAATSAGMPGRMLAHMFLRHVDGDAARAALPAAAAFRLADSNVTDDERARVRAFAARQAR